MVDITVPGMERRCAIMPSISPISRQAAKKRSAVTGFEEDRHQLRARSNDTMTSVESLMVPAVGGCGPRPTSGSDPVTSTKDGGTEGGGGGNSRPSSPASLRRKRKSTANTLRTFLNKFGRASTAESLRNLQLGELSELSKSDDGTLDRKYVVSPSSRRRAGAKQSLHIDISQYKPRRLSRDEYMLRKKMSHSDYMPWMSQHNQCSGQSNGVDIARVPVSRDFQGEHTLEETLEGPPSVLRYKSSPGIPAIVTEEETCDDDECACAAQPLLYTSTCTQNKTQECGDTQGSSTER